MSNKKFLKSSEVERQNEGMAGHSANLLNALQWALSRVEATAELGSNTPEYVKAYHLAWGIDPPSDKKREDIWPEDTNDLP